MNLNVVELTEDLVAIDSVSQRSNAEVSNYLEALLARCGFEVERLEYEDVNGELKVSLVAKKGAGPGGFGFFSHSDTVPGSEWDRNPHDPVVENGKLIGLGSCDMKGPLAATIVASADLEASSLKNPLFIIVTADEEVTYGGVQQVVRESNLFREHKPRYGVVAEPTELKPIYAHKGGARILVTAHGKAAHTSTDLGVSANFLIAPFLAEMTELAKLFKNDESFMNDEFSPPTNGFNMVLDDGGCKTNISSPKTVCTLAFRAMPNARCEEIVPMIRERAEKHSLETSSSEAPPFYVSPESDLIKVALEATGSARAATVPFGSEATVYIGHLEPIVLGPGSITQAHTNGEWIDLAQLEEAVGVYRRMIDKLCK